MLGVKQFGSISYMGRSHSSKWHFIICHKHCSLLWRSRAHHGLFIKCQWPLLIGKRINRHPPPPLSVLTVSISTESCTSSGRGCSYPTPRCASASASSGDLGNQDAWRGLQLLDVVRSHSEMVPLSGIDVVLVDPMETPKLGQITIFLEKLHVSWHWLGRDLPVSAWHLLV